MRDDKTFRQIGETLGISKSWAYELYKKWTPAMDRQLSADNGQEDEDDDEYYDDEYDDRSEPEAAATGQNSPPVLGGVASASDDGVVLSAVEEEIETTENTEAVTEFSAPDPPLSTCLDGYGREIFVESEDVNGKPMIWYQYDEKGNKTCHKRGLFGVKVEHLNTEPYL